MAGKQKIKALGYARTSSKANVGEDKDSEKRQRAAIEKYAKKAGIEIVGWYYDAAVKGSDLIESRKGFADMLDHISGNGVRVIIVETANRFSRDLIVQETGYAQLKTLGITLIAADSPEAFLSDTPTADLIRQVLGAVAQFEKAMLVSKLKVARDRKKAVTGKCGGRKTYNELDATMVAEARRLNDGRSLREIAAGLAEAGFKSRQGNVFAATSIKNMLGAEFTGAALKKTTARGKRILAA